MQYRCSNPACMALHQTDPQGHCPTCRHPDGSGWSCVPDDEPLPQNARPLWIGDLANQIFADWKSWEQEAEELAAIEQNSDTSQYVMLARLEELIEVHWKKVRRNEMLCFVGGYSAAAEICRDREKHAEGNEQWYHRGKAESWEAATKFIQESIGKPHPCVGM